MPLSSFLKRMYAAGARGSFDTLALNAYAPGSDLVIDLVRRAVTVLRRHADPDPRAHHRAGLGHRRSAVQSLRDERVGQPLSPGAPSPV